MNREVGIFLLGAAATAILAACLIAMQQAALGSIRASLAYVLLDWTLAAAILLCVYAILSLEDLRSLLRISLLSSAPAMWFVPAVLLICTPSPALMAIGLLLVANTVRVLVTRGLSRRANLPAVRTIRHGLSRQVHTAPVLSYGRASPRLKSETTIVVLGALVFQLGASAIWAGYGLTAAVLFAAGAMIWTLAAISRGVCEPRKKVDSTFTAVLTLFLTTVISVRQLSLDSKIVSDTALPQITYLTLQRFIHKRPSVSELPRKMVTRVFTPMNIAPPVSRILAEGVEGVILRPEIVPPRIKIIVSRGIRYVSPSSSLEFRFTGEYRLFPVSSRDLKKDWSVETGTPVDSVYATLSGRPLQTEAYQVLDPPVDFTGCRALQLTLVSYQGVPAAAAVQLIGNRNVPDLGPEIFGLDQTREETIEFEVPVSLGGLRVTGIRVIFTCIQEECGQSIRVAVRGFNLIPARL